MKHWRYYERNIQELQRHAKVSAISLFKGLKQLESDEVKLLAERYYKSEDYTNYNESMGDYSTANPISYKTIADKYNRSEKAIQEELKRIERKLGVLIIEHHDLIEREEAKHSIERLEKNTLNELENYKEREIISKAFQQIKSLREKTDDDPLKSI